LGDCGTVLVVDGDARVRDGVRELVDRLGCDVLASKPGQGVLDALSEAPALAVLEVEAERMSGLVLMREVHDRFGGSVPVILVSAARTSALDRTAGLLLGADDYLAKPLDFDELLARMQRSLRRAGAPATGNGRRRADRVKLTARERTILTLLSHGKSQRDIAAELVVSGKTVGTHIQHLLMKLGVHSRTHAVAEAYRLGLVTARPGDRRDSGRAKPPAPRGIDARGAVESV